MAKVNLDALIPREDFEVQDTTAPGVKKHTLSIEDLKPDSFFFTNLRKPDFQRETNEWDSVKVTELITSFVSNDLIPAIILWKSMSGFVFVIDGNHRLSALAAWISNDYGDGEKSKKYYDGILPQEQIDIANVTRALIDKSIGSFGDYELSKHYPDKVKQDVVKNAKNLSSLAVQLQWVEGDARSAENSFFKINQKAAPIDKTELKLLKDRRMPTSVAARAIIRSGKGHKYWSGFENQTQKEIQSIASEINSILFDPKLETPIKTLDLPIAGKQYSNQSLSLIVDMISIVYKKTKTTEDTTGEITIEVLRELKKIAYIINSEHPSSLGLHPIVYFYSQDGRHKNAAFLATVGFLVKLRNDSKLGKFIEIRQVFEKFLLDYDYLIQQINRKYREAQKSHSYITIFYLEVMNGFLRGETIESILKDLQKTKLFSYLSLQVHIEESENQNSKFDTNTKSQICIRELLPSAPKCNICKGYIHRNSISIDHKTRKREGGNSNVDNGQITHPYCNTGVKN